MVLSQVGMYCHRWVGTVTGGLVLSQVGRYCHRWVGTVTGG